MTITPDLIDTVRRTIDLDQLDAGGLYCAARLRSQGAAVVILTPGDSTQYRVMMGRPVTLAPEPGVDPRFARQVGFYSDEAWVVLVGMGEAYPWTIGEEVHPAYVAEKWTRGQEWTAVVLAELLNRTALYWNSRQGTEVARG